MVKINIFKNNSHLRIFLLIFWERETSMTQRETDITVERETSIRYFLCVHQPGIKPATQVCATTRDQTATFWYMGPCLNQLSYLARAKKKPFLKGKITLHQILLMKTLSSNRWLCLYITQMFQRYRFLLCLAELSRIVRITFPFALFT